MNAVRQHGFFGFALLLEVFEGGGVRLSVGTISGVPMKVPSNGGAFDELEVVLVMLLLGVFGVGHQGIQNVGNAVDDVRIGRVAGDAEKIELLLGVGTEIIANGRSSG